MSDNIEFEVDSGDVEWRETAVALQAEIERLRAERDRLLAAITAHVNWYANQGDVDPLPEDHELWSVLNDEGGAP